MAVRTHTLSRDERLQLDRRSEALLGETLAAFAGFDSARLDPYDWKLLARRGQVSVHRAVSSTRGGSDTHKRRAVGTGFLDCSLNDVITSLYSESDEELLTTQTLTSPGGTTAMDASVLLIEERREPRAAPFRFAGVRWYLWNRNDKASHGSLSVDGQESDLLTYERMGTALADRDKDQGTQEVAYHVLLSMHKPEWPLDVARGPGLRRTELAMCFLFRKVCDDLVECFTLVDYDSRVSATSRRAADTEVADRILMSTRLPDCARAKVLSNFARKARSRPVMMSKMCLRCGSKRKGLDVLRNCAICKKSVCQKCYEARPVFSFNSRTHEPETDAFCNKCLVRIEILTNAKNATANKTSGSGDGNNSTGGSSNREFLSGSSGDSSSKRGFKFWRRSSNRAQSHRDLKKLDREQRRQSLPASTRTAASRHKPNYEGLFRNYEVFGSRLNIANQCRPENSYESEQDEQEPDREQECMEPPQEVRKRQTTFLADPDAAAAEAANRESLLRNSIAPVVARELRGNTTIAEVYPVAKTVLDTEDIYAASSDEDAARSNEAERAHLLYLERRQRLDEIQEQPRYNHRDQLQIPLPVQKNNGFAKATQQVKSCPDNRQLRSQSAPPNHIDKKPAAVDRRSESTRGQDRRSRKQQDEDVFRMDLYGRF